MSRKPRSKHIPGPFVPLIKATMETPAWRATSFGARSLYVELRGGMRNDARNNGKFWLSTRDAAKALGTGSTRSIVRWFAELEHYGFIRKTGDGFLGADGRGIAARYRLTEYAHGTNPPSRDFEKWDGELYVSAPSRRAAKKQNPVSLGDTPRAPRGNIRKGSGNGSVCAPQGHIASSAKCAPRGHTSRLATLGAQPTQDQGSSSRAPAQAAGVGSNPAPDASLTEYVLSIVNAELDRLVERKGRLQ